jgi:hypothetical protein
MDNRTYGGLALGVAAAALLLWFARRRRPTELFVELRPDRITPPHGDPIGEGQL